MRQLSFMGRLLMSANDMTDALIHPHPDVPFATVGDDTITALSQLAAILKISLKSLYRLDSLKHQSRPLRTNNHQH
jgi:hypothetical protein